MIVYLCFDVVKHNNNHMSLIKQFKYHRRQFKVFQVDCGFFSYK